VEARDDIAAALKRLCSCLVEFLSSHATDPHLYFELRMSREVSGADSVEALTTLMRQLLDWVDAMNPSASQLARLDAALSGAGLPPYSVLRSANDPEVCDALAGFNAT
jgi:hypothetical protein